LRQSVNTSECSATGTRKGEQMETKYCWDCEADLTPKNTNEFGGLDSGNLNASRSVGFDTTAEMFTKCDDCHNADIDRALENPYD
jgi:hypothetical protein